MNDQIHTEFRGSLSRGQLLSDRCAGDAYAELEHRLCGRAK